MRAIPNIRKGLLLFLLAFVGGLQAQTTYYSKAAATDFNSTASWGINTDGSGASPASITNADNYIIQNNAALTLTANGSVRALTINGGSLTIAANTLTVAIAGANNSTLQVSGGSLNVTGGTLNINGNLLVSDGSNFNQSGGNINIDGNSGNTATSVTSGTDIFSIGTSATPHSSGTIALTGGILTIVDPHAAATGEAFYFNSTFAPVNAIGHTFRFGDGISATAGGSSIAFQYTTQLGSTRFIFGDLIVNGPYNASRVVTNSTGTGVLGNFTVNTGGQYDNSNATLAVNGNITVNGVGTSNLANNGRLLATGIVYLTNYQSGLVSPSTNAQTISGNGYFVNNTTIGSSTANFNWLIINNTNASGVIFANANTLTSVIPGLYTNTATASNNFNLSGKLNIGTNTFTLGISVASPGFLNYTSGGFTGGTFKRWVNTSAISPLTGGAVARGAFPFISANGESRLLQYGQTTTVTPGGTVSVTYNDVAGQTSITPYTDNGVTIANRSNSNWVVATGNGLTYGSGGTGILKIRGDGYTVANLTDARISGVSGAAAGTSGVGTNTLAAPEGNKSAMTVANLAGTFYFATPSCAPPVPVANTTTPGCSSFTASWSNVGATGYLLFVATDTLFTNLVTGYDSLYVGGGATSYNVNTNLLPGQTYYYRVKGFNSSTCISNASNFISVTIPSTTVAPIFTAGATTICANGTDTYTATATVGTVTYSIVGGTGSSINATTGVLSSAGTANFTVRATSTGTCGGPFFTDRAVTVTPTTVAPTFIAGATTICANGTDTYTATTTVGTVTYTVVGGTGATINATTGVLSSAGTANFTVRATSTGTCGGPFFTDRAVTVTPTTVAPTFTAGATTICANGTSTYTATTTLGTVTYSIVGGSGASINATTGVLSSAGTANFTVRATSTGTCGGPFFTDRAVTVNPLPAIVVATAGTAATTSAITTNWGAAANATSYILEVSTLSNFASTVFNSNIGNVTTYTVGGLTANTTYYFRVTAVNSCGSAAVSNAITYATLPNVTGPLTWNGSVSTDWNDANNWTPNTIPTALDDVIIPNLANDPVLSTGAMGACKDVSITGGAPISIASGYTLDVKGNWTGTTATIVSGAGKTIFSGTSGAQTITGGVTFSTLVIDNTTGVTIAAGAPKVRVTTALELKAGQLITNGNFVTVSTALNTAYIDDFSPTFAGNLSGNVAVERYITNGPNGYRYIGAPVATTAGGSTLALSALSGFVISGTPGQLIPLPTCSPTNSAQNSPYGTFMRWEEAGPFLYNCRQSGWWFQTTGTMTIGRGYGAKVGSGTKITYTGAANTGSISYGPLANSGPVGNGWHLVSNPFPSSMTISNVDANPNNNMPAGFNGQIQLYITSGPFTGSYLAYNTGLVTAPFALGQGFWVQSTGSGTYTVNNNYRVTNQVNYYDVNSDIQHHLKVDVAGNGFMDKTDIYFLPTAQTGVDFYDAEKWESRSVQPTLYTSIGSQMTAINSLPSLEETIVVPMGIKPGANGEFTFTFDDIATFPQTSMIYLEDLQLGTMNDLRADNTYTFTANVNDNADRFMLHFQPGLQAEVADQDCDNAGSIELTQPAPTIWSTYEVRGNDNNVYAQGTDFTGSTTITNLPPQEYVVTVTHASGYSAQEYITVNGNSPVNATINASVTNVMVDEMVSLTGTATDATEYVWNFGDGNTQTGSANVLHAYDAEGTYNVTLTATNDACNDIAVKTINVANTTTAINNASAKNLNAYGSGNRIVVEFNNWGEGKANLTVYNMLGQQLNSITGVSTIKGRQELQLTGIKPGYYLLKVTTQDEQLYKKLYLSE